MALRLNVGSGKDIKEGYINIDSHNYEGVDLVVDINEGLPYPKNIFDEVYASHILEHVQSPEKILEELCRITKEGALIVIKAPHFSSMTAYWNLDHKTFWSYFSLDWLKNKKFCILQRQLNFMGRNHTWLNVIFNPLINLTPMFYERFLCWMLPCSEVEFHLRVEK